MSRGLLRTGDISLISSLWRRIPPPAMDRLATWASRLALAAPAPGGGRLIVARKPQEAR